MHKRGFQLACLCCLFLTANMGTSGDSASLSEEANQKKLVSGYVSFGIDLYSDIFSRESGENIFLSPSSVAVALAMTYNGSAGETQEAMASLLGFEGMERDEVNQANASLIDALESLDPEVRLEIANSLWARKGIAFKPEFMKTNRDFFKAEVTELDFSRPEAPAIINEWVNRKTHEKIQKIVDGIDPMSVLFLINAIYFKGKWTEEFDQGLTKDLPFHLAGGGSKSVPMMSQKGEFRYLERDDFQAIQLPYGEKRVSMVVLLPARDSSLKSFVQSLSADSWEAWMSQFERVQGEIVLPKYKIEYEKSLNDPLMNLGMKIAFSREKADFSRMCEVPPVVYINEVKHKSYVDVNEEGTEAAAVTSVEMRVASAAPPSKRFRMVVDRPFFFAIRDGQTGLLLFMGSITDPQPDQ